MSTLRLSTFRGLRSRGNEGKRLLKVGRDSRTSEFKTRQTSAERTKEVQQHSSLVLVASEEALQVNNLYNCSVYLLYMTIYLVVVVREKNYSVVVVCLSRVTKM